MLGDKVKRMCEHILNIRLTNEGTKYKAREAMEELNELLQYKEKYERFENLYKQEKEKFKNEYEELFKENKQLKEELEQAEEAGKTAMMGYLSNKEDAELGKAIKCLTENKSKTVDIVVDAFYLGDCEESYEIDELLDWYKQQTEMEDENE